MLRVTFYSYKGGVGRTLAMLNVAAVLAQHDRRVVAVDLDLEAPGFGLSHLTAALGELPGASDLLLGRQEDKDIDIEQCQHAILTEQCGQNLRLVPAGTRTDELIQRLPGFYTHPDHDDAYLFEWLAAHIGDALQPDYLLFDSRTGRADIAGVCAVELPDVLVAVCGLNEQNRNGMHRMLTEIAEHPARAPEHPVATVLALSPVPRPADLGVRPVASLFADPLQPVAGGDIDRERESNALMDALYRAQVQLMPDIRRGFHGVKSHFAGADASDLYHELPYDPMVPLSGEYRLTEQSPLRRAYERLARTLTRLHGRDQVLAIADIERPPVLIDFTTDDRG